MPEAELVHNTDKVLLINSMMEMTGWPREQCESSLEAVTAAITSWMQGMVEDCPEGSKVRLGVKGFGTFVIEFKAARTSKWRKDNGIPQRPALLSIKYNAPTSVKDRIREINRPIRAAYTAAYRPLITAWRAEHERKWIDKPNKVEDPQYEAQRNDGISSNSGQ